MKRAMNTTQVRCFPPSRPRCSQLLLLGSAAHQSFTHLLLSYTVKDRRSLPYVHCKPRSYQVYWIYANTLIQNASDIPHSSIHVPALVHPCRASCQNPQYQIQDHLPSRRNGPTAGWRSLLRLVPHHNNLRRPPRHPRPRYLGQPWANHQLLPQRRLDWRHQRLYQRRNRGLPLRNQLFGITRGHMVRCRHGVRYNIRHPRSHKSQAII